MQVLSSKNTFFSKKCKEYLRNSKKSSNFARFFRALCADVINIINKFRFY